MDGALGISNSEEMSVCPERLEVAEILRSFKMKCHGPYAIAMIDQEGKFKCIDPTFKELFGYGIEDVPDVITWFRKAYPDPAYRLGVIFKWVDHTEAAAPDEEQEGSVIIVCKDGTKKDARVMTFQLDTCEHLLVCEVMAANT